MIALFVIRRDDSILVFEAFDSAMGSPFYRPLGGGVKRGETSEAAIVREIREELSLEIMDLHLLGTLENIFTYEGELGHEAVFVYEGRFADTASYAVEEFTVTEDDGSALSARWIPLQFFDDYHRLVPRGLKELIDA
ncbi:MAG TPA: NUDIX domain-containing protein [Actinomycetota bacterium]|nr:NUDIX domain-containing protein [Actinomycetota bacterium]